MRNYSAERIDVVTTHIELLKRFNACAEAVVYANKYPDLESAWNACPRSDWMLFLLNKLGYQDNRVLRLYACWCVRNTPLADGRVVWDLLSDVSKAAVEVSERFADGRASSCELRAAAADAACSAARAADAAARAADAAYFAACSAAYSAAYSVARAADAAYFAARAAVRAAARVADAPYSAQADQLRTVIQWSVITEPIGDA
jgi:hypothetical protein